MKTIIKENWIHSILSLIPVSGRDESFPGSPDGVVLIGSTFIRASSGKRDLLVEIHLEGGPEKMCILPVNTLKILSGGDVVYEEIDGDVVLKRGRSKRKFSKIRNPSITRPFGDLIMNGLDDFPAIGTILSVRPGGSKGKPWYGSTGWNPANGSFFGGSELEVVSSGDHDDLVFVSTLSLKVIEELIGGDDTFWARDGGDLIFQSGALKARLKGRTEFYPQALMKEGRRRGNMDGITIGMERFRAVVTACGRVDGEMAWIGDSFIAVSGGISFVAPAPKAPGLDGIVLSVALMAAISTLPSDEVVLIPIYGNGVLRRLIIEVREVRAVIMASRPRPDHVAVLRRI